MGVRALEIRSIDPYAGGAEWGAAGAHERVSGIARFAVDPLLSASARICDLDQVETAADGLVHFDADFCVLRPTAPGRSRRLLFAVPNRGMPGGLPFSRGTSLVESPTAIAPGDGFALRRGWTVAWCGWQWDVPRGGGFLGLTAPQATRGAARAAVRVAFRLDAAAPHRRLADSIPQLVEFAPYPAADLEEADAVLCVRDWPEGPPRAFERSRWRFARERDGAPVPDAEHVWLEGGFEPHRFYELIYTTRCRPVAGAGLLAVRDFTSFLRGASAAEGNPCASGLDCAIATGISQSGRFLRHFLYEGMNLDESGRRVFDGVLAHIAGARRGEFNQRSAQPSLTYPAGFGNLPPFGDDLLARQRELGGAPRVIFTNSAFEYWRGDAALAHVDPATGKDLPDPPDVRSYLFAGADHIGDVPLFKDRMPLVNRPNPLDMTLALRAAFINLERWICEGIEPPASRVPRSADATAVSRAEVLQRLASIPGLRLPAPEALPATPILDLGPDAARGIGRWPARVQGFHPALVSAVDADGNERAGVLLPERAVPLGTYTGWNPRRALPGLPDVLYEFAGSFAPFAASERERAMRGDPRPSRAARYRDRSDYAVRVRSAAQALVAERLLLAEDVDAAVAGALARYDSLEEAMTAKKIDLSLVGDAHVRRYRETNGAEGHIWNGAPCLVLSTRRRSGAARDSALIYGRDGENYLVIASKGGAPEHPWWYRDLVANPSVEVQVLSDRFRARARTASPAEKAKLWPIMTRVWPSYDTYQQNTRRDIPLVILERS
jgi:deazaflavin-dependent oxidoreductase (nitroreductase family)